VQWRKLDAIPSCSTPNTCILIFWHSAGSQCLFNLLKQATSFPQPRVQVAYPTARAGSWLFFEQRDSRLNQNSTLQQANRLPDNIGA
jgi:hypothetical protein